VDRLKKRPYVELPSYPKDESKCVSYLTSLRDEFLVVACTGLYGWWTHTEITIVAPLTNRYGKISTVIAFDASKFFPREEHRSRSVILIDQPISRPVSSVHFLLNNVLLAQAHAAQHGYDQGEPKSISSRVPQKTSNTTIWGTFGESASKKRLQKRGPSQPCPSNSVRMHAF
jgi:hypothetical protein